MLMHLPFSQLDGLEIVVLICIPVITNEGDYFFMFICHLDFFFCEVPVKVFDLFFFPFVLFLLDSWESWVSVLIFVVCIVGSAPLPRFAALFLFFFLSFFVCLQ